jgi:hypothetical protein
MRVICTLPHCSTLINGWSFESTPIGWVSEDLPVDVAQRFLTIPGYARWGGSENVLAPSLAAVDAAAHLPSPSDLPRPVSRRSRTQRNPV